MPVSLPAAPGRGKRHKRNFYGGASKGRPGSDITIPLSDYEMVKMHHLGEFSHNFYGSSSVTETPDESASNAVCNALPLFMDAERIEFFLMI